MERARKENGLDELDRQNAVEEPGDGKERQDAELQQETEDADVKRYRGVVEDRLEREAEAAAGQALYEAELADRVAQFDEPVHAAVDVLGVPAIRHDGASGERQAQERGRHQHDRQPHEGRDPDGLPPDAQTASSASARLRVALTMTAE